jgi:hypothetical protein
MGEAKEIVKTKWDGIRSIESKAAAQITVATSAVGLLSIIGPKASDHIRTSPFFYGGVALVFLALVANAICLWPTGYRYSSLEQYNDTDTVLNPAFKSRIELELTEGYLKTSRRLEIPATRKARSFTVATSALILGILALFVNYAIAIQARDPGQDMLLRCRTGGDGTFSCRARTGEEFLHGEPSSGYSAI